MFVLKLPHFSLGYKVREKRVAISKSPYIWTPSSWSYIVFALKLTQFAQTKKTTK